MDYSSDEDGGINDLSGHGAPIPACNPSSSSEKYNQIYENTKKRVEV